MSTYDLSTLYTTLPHNLIKDKIIDLIERTFLREGSPYLACNDRNAFFTSEKPKKYHASSCQNVCDALTFLLDNIFIYVRLQEFLIGGGGGGVHTRLFPSPQRILQWFINSLFRVKLFLGGGGWGRVV